MAIEQGSAPNEGPDDDWAGQIRRAKSEKRSKTWIAAAAASAVVLVLTVGGVALVNVMGGGGPQPEDVLPANAVAFVKLDLDPSAGQKLAAYQLSAKFPAIKRKVSSEDTSIKESIFGSLFTGDTKVGGTSLGLKYKTDVAPWLGDRVGVGVFPDIDADKKPELAVAIAFTDQAAAKAALDKAIANRPKSKQQMGYAFADAFVVVSDTTAHAAALVRAGKAAPLATSTYAEDVQKLGQDQVAIAWVDVAGAFKAAMSSLPKSVTKGVKVDDSKVAGRIVEGVHLDSSYVEVTAMASGVKGASALANADAGADASLIESFPSGVLGALTANGLGKSVGALYTSLTKADGTVKRNKATAAAASGGLGFSALTGQCACRVKSFLSGLGLDSAKKIENLLGSETGVMVAGDNLRKPQVAIRTRGSNPDAAVATARKALARVPVPGGLQIRKAAAPVGIFIGTPSTGSGFNLVKETFSSSGTKLGADEAFRQVIPRDQKASFAAYVNLSKVLPLLAKGPGSGMDMETVKPFKALGFTAVGGSDPSVRLRVSFR
jgi:hypothetical protein